MLGYTVRYDALNAMLLNEFLKEHRKVQEQEKTIFHLGLDCLRVSRGGHRLCEEAARLGRNTRCRWRSNRRGDHCMHSKEGREERAASADGARSAAPRQMDCRLEYCLWITRLAFAVVALASFTAIFLFDAPIRSSSDEISRYLAVFAIWLYPVFYGIALVRSLASLRKKKSLPVITLPALLPLLSPLCLIAFFSLWGTK
jgi:hypothetical protein